MKSIELRAGQGSKSRTYDRCWQPIDDGNHLSIVLSLVTLTSGGRVMALPQSANCAARNAPGASWLVLTQREAEN